MFGIRNNKPPFDMGGKMRKIGGSSKSSDDATQPTEIKSTDTLDANNATDNLVAPDKSTEPSKQVEPIENEESNSFNFMGFLLGDKADKKEIADNPEKTDKQKPRPKKKNPSVDLKKELQSQTLEIDKPKLPDIGNDKINEAINERIKLEEKALSGLDEEEKPAIKPSDITPELFTKDIVAEREVNIDKMPSHIERYLYEDELNYDGYVVNPEPVNYRQLDNKINTGDAIISLKDVPIANTKKQTKVGESGVDATLANQPKEDPLQSALGAIIKRIKSTEAFAEIIDENNHLMTPPLIKTHLPYLALIKGDDVSTVSAFDLSTIKSIDNFEQSLNALKEKDIKPFAIFSQLPNSEQHRYDDELSLVDINGNLPLQLMCMDIADLNSYSLGFDVSRNIRLRGMDYYGDFSSLPELDIPTNELRALTTSPLHADSLEALRTIKRINNKVRQIQSQEQVFDFYKTEKHTLEISELQNKIFASYAKEIQDTNQDDLSGYKDFYFDYWEIYSRDNEQIDTIFKQYQQLSATLHFYCGQLLENSLITTEQAENIRLLLGLAHKELINILSTMLLLPDCQNDTKNGFVPIVCLYDTKELISLVNKSKIINQNKPSILLLHHAYAAIFGVVSSYVETNHLPSSLKRIAHLLAGLLQIDLSPVDHKLPNLPLNALNTLSTVLKERLKLRFSLLEDGLIDYAQVYIANTSDFEKLSSLVSKGNHFTLITVNFTENSLLENIFNLVKGLNNIKTAVIGDVNPLQSYFDDHIKFMYTNNSKTQLSLEPTITKGVFVNKSVLNVNEKVKDFQIFYYFADYQPVNYTQLMISLKDMVASEVAFIKKTIDELPIKLLSRMEDVSFYPDAMKFKRLHVEEKYIFAYKYLNPTVPDSYINQMLNIVRGAYPCKALRATPKTNVCPNLLYQNTPVLTKYFDFLSVINKDFFYEREEWIVDLGVFHKEDKLVQYFYRMGDIKLLEKAVEEEILDIWNVKSGKFFQTHFVATESVCFTFNGKKAVMANTPSRISFGLALQYYRPTSGMDKMFIMDKINTLDKSNKTNTILHDNSLKPLLIQDHTKKIFDIFSVDYS